MHFRKAETSVLIRAVKAREILWNNTHGKFFHQSYKKLAWLEVCGELFKDFRKLDEDVQNNLVQDVIKRWRTVRDNYVRKCKENAEVQNSGSGDEPRRKKYVFEDELSFLGDKRLRRRSSTNSHLGQVSHSELNFEEQEDTPSLATSIPQLSPKREIESPVEDGRIQQEDISEHFTQQLDPFDEDVGFFISLLPTVKSLSRAEKLDFRIKTMQLLQRQCSQRVQGNSSGQLEKAEFSACDNEDDEKEQMFFSENE